MLVALMTIIKMITIFISLLMKTMNSTLIDHASAQKLIELSVKNSKQKSTFLHEINEFWIEKTVDMWAEIFSLFVLNQD